MTEITGVHPFAARFPMLPDDELQELAADIKANGLKEPIVVDDSGLLIDGRNRREACRIAGIEPAVRRLNGEDPIAFILSRNVTRRHLSKGQRAMAAAIGRRFNNNNLTQARAAGEAGVAQGLVGWAFGQAR